MENEGLQFLYLSEPDMLEAGVLDMKQCVRTMEDMFLLAGKGDYIMGGPGKLPWSYALVSGKPRV